MSKLEVQYEFFKARVVAEALYAALQLDGKLDDFQSLYVKGGLVQPKAKEIAELLLPYIEEVQRGLGIEVKRDGKQAIVYPRKRTPLP